MVTAYIYDTLIKPWIAIYQRPVFRKKDLPYLWIKKRMLLNSSILLHSGLPCGRYCICPYFTNDDMLCLYSRYLHTNDKFCKCYYCKNH